MGSGWSSEQRGRALGPWRLVDGALLGGGRSGHTTRRPGGRSAPSAQLQVASTHDKHTTGGQSGLSLQLPARCQLDPQFRKGHTCDGHRALDTPVSLLGTGQVGFLQVHAGPGGRDGVSICSHRPAFTCLLRNHDAPQTVRRILFLGSKTSGGGCIQEPAQFGTWGKKK